MKYCGQAIPHNWDMNFGKFGGLPTLIMLIAFLKKLASKAEKIIVLSMSVNEFSEVPHTIELNIKFH